MNIHFTSQLKELADPKASLEPLNVSGWNSNQLVSLLKDMLTIRYTEEAIVSLLEKNKANCPCHLGIGQEAIAVGISHRLRSSDRVFGAHRSHAHYLALGGSVFKLLAEVLGKVDGCSKGRGGSMHLCAPEVGFSGSVPIVAGTIPIAVGAAIAAKMDKSDNIAVAYFGDGASEEGSLHESLNLAKTYNLPILFVCENNLYSSHLDIKTRQPSDRIARFAKAHCMPNVSLDGNNVIKISEKSKDLISSIRNGEGPAFLELVTYRWLGHVGHDENIDVGIRRSKEDLAAWKNRDPIKRLISAMRNENMVYDNDIFNLQNNIKNEINELAIKAEFSKFPETCSLLEHVYYT